MILDNQVYGSVWKEQSDYPDERSMR